jgi:prevent-host-death family protein
MATVPATEFKAKCLELMDRVAERRETYVITKRGKPVAKLVPADPPTTRRLFGCMADQTEFVGDIEKPLYTDKAWEEFLARRARQAMGQLPRPARKGNRSKRSRGTSR